MAFPTKTRQKKPPNFAVPAKGVKPAKAQRPVGGTKTSELLKRMRAMQ
jgi:hypothetical protein